MDQPTEKERPYSEMVAELETIVQKMQSNQCDIDHLAEYTARASKLLQACRARLTTTEQHLQETLASLKQE